jgi:hypothetical protein
VLREHQHKVADYITHHYENVSVMVQDKWLRLDFNKDGHVSFDDLRRGIQSLYTFMINYNYYLKATEIKSKLYNEAIKYMKRDLRSDDEREEEEVFEMGGDSDQKDDNVLSD